MRSRIGVALALLCLGCSTTEIELVLRSETSVPLVRVEIEVRPNASHPTVIAEAPEFPATLVIRPNDGAEDAVIDIAARGFTDAGLHGEVRAEGVAFVPGRSRVVVLSFGDPCGPDMACPGAQQCVQGMCVSPDVDAGASDAGPLDAGPGRDGAVDGAVDGGSPGCTEDGLCASPHRLSAGDDHTCQLRGTGPECWGMNRSGRLGDGTRTSRGAATAVSATTPLVEISAGGSFSCAVTSIGQVLCWGANFSGELGTAPSAGSLLPEPVPGLGDAERVVTGESFACAVHRDRGVSCWGASAFGQLGPGVTAPAPTRVAGVNDVADLAAGDHHICALRLDGTVLCWGDNRFLGARPSSKGTPVAPESLAGVSVEAIDASASHTCAIVDGLPNIRCWSHADIDALGVMVSGPTFGPTGEVTVPGAVELALGDGFSCARTGAGDAWCWGDDAGRERLGVDGATSTRTPAEVPLGSRALQELVAGRDHACGLGVDGVSVCWGSDGSGQLARGATMVRGPSVVTLRAGRATGALGSGDRRSCAYTSPNQIVCWGDGRHGRLGDGGTVSSSIPVNAGAPTLVSVARAIVGSAFGMAIVSSDSEAFVFGLNTQGRLGVETPSYLNTPTMLPVTLPTASAGSVALGLQHGCAIASDGQLRCFGQNSRSALGISGGIRTTPTAVPGVFLQSVAAGRGHTCGESASGALLCWGDNRSGQSGAAPSDSVPTPTAVAGVTSVRGIAAGTAHTCFEDTEEVRCFGRNTDGQLGRPGSSSPMPMRVVFPGLTDWTVDSVSAGGDTTCAIVDVVAPTAEDNVLFCWGANAHAQTGAVGADAVNSPQRVTSPGASASFLAVAVGQDHVCARTAAEELVCWGFDGEGATGSERDLSYLPGATR